MDMLCPVCAEPYDNDFFHEMGDELGMTYQALTRLFMQKGCEALGEKHNGETTSNNSAIISAMYDLLGDDTDGAMAMLEDAELLGYMD